MKFFLPKPLTFISTNVAEAEDELGGTYTTYSLTEGLNKGHIRKYGQNIYEALTTIYPLAHYVWEDAVLSDIHLHDLHNQVDVYPTGTPPTLFVTLVSGVTVFYVRSLSKWFIAKVSGSYDLLLETYPTPAHFNEITTVPVPYRYEEQFPVGTEDTLYWGYNGVANKYRAFDRAIGTQMTKHGADLTMSLSASACNALSIFNVYATSVAINVYDNFVPASPILIYSGTMSLTDTSQLDTYEKVCTVPATLKPSETVFFQARYAQKIDLTFSGVTNPAVGAIKAGLLDYLGQALDGVDVGVKSYNIVEQRPNGELVWNKNNLETNKVNTLRYNVKLDTTAFDTTATKLKQITDQEVVLLGDDADPTGFKILNSYGAVKSVSAGLRSNDTKSTATIEIENFV